MNENLNRICDDHRKTKRGKIHINEPSDRTEDRNHIEQTADDQKPHPDGLYGYGTWADRISGYTGDHRAKINLGSTW